MAVKTAAALDAQSQLPMKFLKPEVATKSYVDGKVAEGGGGGGGTIAAERHEVWPDYTLSPPRYKRPATTDPCDFMDPDVEPGIDGSVLGGGGMVPDGTLPNKKYDRWWSA